MTGFFQKNIRAFKIYFLSIVEVFLASLPNLYRFSTMRVWYWRKRGYPISKSCYLARNVFFRGKISIGEGCSISDNCIFNGRDAGIYLGDKVMISSNCVFVAFDHGFSDLETPMIDQACQESPIYIEDDVWISANCTITKGVRLGKGCIVGANTAVTQNVEPFDIVGGVPAKVIAKRKNNLSQT